MKSGVEDDLEVEDQIKEQEEMKDLILEAETNREEIIKMMEEDERMEERIFQPNLKNNTYEIEIKSKKTQTKKKSKKKVIKKDKEILPNNEIHIIESNEQSIKNYLNFSPVHNSNLISWVKLKDDEKNLARAYACGHVIKDNQNNFKIFLNGKKKKKF
jgi:hypothetical protein